MLCVYGIASFAAANSYGRVKKESEFRAEQGCLHPPQRKSWTSGWLQAVLPLCLHTCTSTFNSKKASTIDKELVEAELMKYWSAGGLMDGAAQRSSLPPPPARREKLAPTDGGGVVGIVAGKWMDVRAATRWKDRTAPAGMDAPAARGKKMGPRAKS
uniref:Uncharacterized protein n=1 Tax=Oryza rufipogon TaxID=4529 RepID=A0A0E0R7K6_ORYRU